MNPDLIRIRVLIDDPSGTRHVWLDLSRAEFRSAFDPLPRDRELPFMPEARVREMEQREARNRAASIISRRLAPAIVEAISKIDPINGYDPAEWAKIHSTT